MVMKARAEMRLSAVVIINHQSVFTTEEKSMELFQNQLAHAACLIAPGDPLL